MSDRLKTCLTGGQLNYVLSLEGEDLFRPDKVATLADIHLNNRLSGNSSRPVDNRPAVANATPVNVDSQLSEYAGDIESLLKLIMVVLILIMVEAVDHRPEGVVMSAMFLAI